jgi:hypothetical protein
MAKEKMPEFIIYQASAREFHICFRVESRYLRWCSYYAPTPDVRFARKVTRIADVAAAKLPAKPVYDKGSYTVHKSDTRDEAEQKLAAGAGERSFAFILYGKKLQGRFLLKNNGTRTVLQKYKDKYATEEDVLAGDLERTIQTMLPDYDQSKIKLPRREQGRKPTAAATAKPEPHKEKAETAPERPAPRKAAARVEKVTVPKKEKPVPEITADKKIGGTSYHFTFYSSDAGEMLCLATGSSGAVVLQLKGRQWRLLQPAGKAVWKLERAFAGYAKDWYKKQKS